MTGTINNTKYAEILATALPRKIETEEENERVLKIIENLMRSGEDNLSPEEETLLKLFRTPIWSEAARSLTPSPTNSESSLTLIFGRTDAISCTF